MNATTSRLYRKFTKDLGHEGSAGRRFYRQMKKRHTQSNSIEKAAATKRLREALS